MTKALLHELGKSLSFGRLSLKAKVLWPMLLASSDDQGRGMAEADAVKWYVCPNVPEVMVEDVPELLGELVTQGMVVLYQSDRDCTVYQVIRWWEYQQLRWARASKYAPPADWVDRIRYSDRGQITLENWDTDGGFTVPYTPPIPTVNCTENPRDNQPNLTELNSTQSNLTQDQEHGADAPPAIAGPPPIPSTFPQWQECVKTSTNRPATLRWMCEVLYPGLDPPEYGRIGTVARKVGGAGRLADLLWQHCTHPPTGDLMSYIQAISKGNGNRGNGENSGDVTLRVIERLEAEERANNTG